MPPPRKVELLPAELRQWLHEWWKEKGFHGYEDLAEELNFRLEQDGLELRIGKSALHAYGQEYEHFVKLQDEAGAWAQQWLADNDLSEEADRHRVLFQMMTSVAFKVLKAQMGKDGEKIDPRELHFLGKMMKDVMSSAGIREQLMAKERERIAAEAAEAARAEASAQLETGVATGRIDAAAAQAAREVMGMA
ncbi:phage protein Gp27 family protein [Roseovarius ramblicola]|uniref:Phage protein Gp27 family protein n=1 Tax=Roseovarius ramblicola TaxID=2022336 RepID=A0ABV5HWD9_9RHOB